MLPSTFEELLNVVGPEVTVSNTTFVRLFLQNNF